MKIRIPESTMDQIASLKMDGDFALISIAIHGNNSKRSTVMRNIESGSGEEDVVQAIVKFYKDKATSIKKLTAKAQV